MGYNIKSLASEAIETIEGTDIDMSELTSVITLDDKPLDLSKVEQKIKDIITDTKDQLDSVQDIEVSV